MNRLRTLLVAWCFLAQLASATPITGNRTAQPATPVRSVKPTDSDDLIVNALNRLTFGPRTGDIEAVRSMGLQAYIDQQLNPTRIQESPAVLSALASVDALRSSCPQLIDQYRAAQKANRQAKIAAKDQGVKPEPTEAMKYLHQLGQQYMSLRLLREIESPRQLQEVMTDFWFNHFNVCLNKGLDRVLVGPYEEQAIRPYALGKFRDLLEATCFHPAMLFYLDNWENSATGSRGLRGKTSGLNENYARELMELHTLGVDGGYTQKDVIALARILTGLGIGGSRQAYRLQPVGRFGALFYANRHDFGDKVFLGQTIRGSGVGEIQQALELLSREPSTAHHIAYQLAQFFVCDKPPAILVDRLARRFRETDGEIKAVLQELFSSPEFWSPANQNSKYKSPLRYVISALRASDAHPTSYQRIIGFLRLQGEPLYGCLTPDGYKNTKDAWLNPDALLRRIDFATILASGRMRNVLPNPPDYRNLGATISDSAFSTRTVEAVMKAPEQLKSALVLGSPDFMHY